MDKSYFFEIPVENIIEESETKTRGLCGLTDYEKLSRKDIERQAYDSWMDGAK